MIAMLTRTLNEEEGITDCLQYHQRYVDYISVIDGGSTDATFEKAHLYADKVVEDTDKHWGDFTTRAVQALPKGHEWVLIVDVDERLDRDFLRNMRKIISQYETTSFRFPRINMPHAVDYPDYQVRLIRTDRGVQWMNHVHEVATLEGVHINKVSCLTLHKYPIIHSERRVDLKRPWWRDDGGIIPIEEL